MTPLLHTAVAEALDALADASAQPRAAELGEVLAITRAVDACRIDEDSAWEAFGESITSRVDGTTGVPEFLTLEISAILGVSPRPALSRIVDVLTVRTHFPFPWATFLEGELRWWQIIDVILRPGISALSAEGARWLDHQLSVAMRTCSWQRVRSRTSTWGIQADPAVAATREARARQDRHVTIDRIHDGHCTLYGRLAARDAIDLDHALDTVADTIPAETGSKAQRRAAAIGILARHSIGQDTLPEVTLVVHINADDPALTGADETCGVAEINHWGTLLSTQLPEFLKDSKVTVRPVIDPWRITPQDGHDPSIALWTAVTALMPIDMFPYGSIPSDRCDIDHTIPYDPDTPGSTRWGNLAPLSRMTHRAKTFGGWRMTHLAPGVIHWTSPAGFEYLVTAWGGALHLKRPERPPHDEEPPPPWLDPPEPPDHPNPEQDTRERLQYELTL